MVTTRAPVAGSYGRSFTAEELAECWTHAARALNLTYRCDMGEISLESKEQLSQRLSLESPECQQSNPNTPSIDGEDSQKYGESLLVSTVESIQGAIRKAAAALERTHRESEQELIVCVTGSLHAVAATLTLIPDKQIQH